MGILDDLKSQAEQGKKPAGEQLSPADVEEFYRAHIKQRMLMANGFFTQFVNQLNEMNLLIKAEYPFRPGGKKVTLLQQGYKAYSDHITEPRRVTLNFTCILANPTTYDVRDRGPAMVQGELLDRYQFKYEKLEARDQSRMVIGARFKLQGPLQVNCVLQFDEVKQIIKLLLTNFVGPGTSQYNLKPEQLDESFMDHLCKYLLRKETNLFKEEISDEAKAMLRKKLQQEQQQREAELRAIEEQRLAEEAARKQNSTTEQLKKAVSQSVVENREKIKKVMDEQVREKGEKLKTMFNKLKNRAGNEKAPEQTTASPAVNTSQTAKPSGNPAVQGLPPVDRPVGQTASAQQNATRPKPSADQKTPTPPKVFQSSASNPFLKPEDFEPVLRAGEEQTEADADTKNPVAQIPAGTATPATAKTPNLTMTPAAVQARPTAESTASAAKTANPFLQTKATAGQARPNNPTGQSPGRTMPPATPTTSPATSQAKSEVETSASAAKTANPFLQTKATVGQVETKKQMAQSPAQATTPVTPTTSSVAEAEPVVTPDTSDVKTTNPSMQAKPPAAPDESGLSLEPIASDSESFSPAAPAEPKLSLVPNASDSESSSPAASAKSGLSLVPNALDAESSSPAAPTKSGLSLVPNTSDAESTSPAVPAESGLSLEPTTSDTEPSLPAAPDVSNLSLEPAASAPEFTSPAAPAESGLSLEPTTSDSESSSPAAQDELKLSQEPIASEAESSSLATKTEVPQPESTSDLSALSLEDQLERDLARFMENGQQQPTLDSETSDDPSSISAELDIDLSAPDALKIHFEDTDKASDKGNY